MVEVTKENFSSLLPEILCSIEAAAFISIDAEFTGLLATNNNKASLFDGGEERYQKSKVNTSQFIISQIGLSCFTAESFSSYTAKVYKFYICPLAFASVDDTFSMQASSLSFLTCYGFDFNKFIYKGIPYLNAEQKNRIMSDLRNDVIIRAVGGGKSSSQRDELEMQQIFSAAAEWLVTAKEGETKELHIAPHLPYVIHKELRTRFSDCWTQTNNDQFLLRKVSKEERRTLLCAADDIEDELLQHLSGFSVVYEKLVASNKVIVGHNVFLDLVMSYKQFYRQLPGSYKGFKSDLLAMFSSIYDTKLISWELRRLLEELVPEQFTSGSWSLSELYTTLESDKVQQCVLYQPSITLHDHSAYTEDNIHDAGFDAYMTGCIFIRMAHIYTWKMRNDPEKSVSFSEYRRGVQQFRNKIHIARAAIPHLNLEGGDPDSKRPQWLILSPRNGHTIDTVQIAEMLSVYGNVDVKPWGKSVIVAVSTFKSARAIIKSCNKKRNGNVQANTYSAVRHNYTVKYAIMGGALVCGMFGVYLLIKATLQPP